MPPRGPLSTGSGHRSPWRSEPAHVALEHPDVVRTARAGVSPAHGRVAGSAISTSVLRRLSRPGLRRLLAAAINSTVVAGENPTVGSTVWLPAESVAPGR